MTEGRFWKRKVKRDWGIRIYTCMYVYIYIYLITGWIPGRYRIWYDIAVCFESESKMSHLPFSVLLLHAFKTFKKKTIVMWRIRYTTFGTTLSSGNEKRASPNQMFDVSYLGERKRHLTTSLQNVVKESLQEWCYKSKFGKLLSDYPIWKFHSPSFTGPGGVQITRSRMRSCMRMQTFLWTLDQGSALWGHWKRFN